jgi:uncharacterized membrane protein
LGFGTYILKVLMVLGGLFLVIIAIFSAILRTTDWTLIVSFILLIIGLALFWYGKEMRDCPSNKTNNETKTLIRVSFSIAIIIFFTALLSDFSVRMFYSSNDWFVKVFAGLVAILIIASVIMVLMWAVKDIRKPFLRIFGEQ